MEKRNEKKPEEVAIDLENIDFAEIEEDDLREIFGGLEGADGDCNCGCINNGCGGSSIEK